MYIILRLTPIESYIMELHCLDAPVCFMVPDIVQYYPERDTLKYKLLDYIFAIIARSLSRCSQ